MSRRFFLNCISCLIIIGILSIFLGVAVGQEIPLDLLSSEGEGLTITTNPKLPLIVNIPQDISITQFKSCVQSVMHKIVAVYDTRFKLRQFVWLPVFFPENQQNLHFSFFSKPQNFDLELDFKNENIIQDKQYISFFRDVAGIQRRVFTYPLTQVCIFHFRADDNVWVSTYLNSYYFQTLEYRVKNEEGDEELKLIIIPQNNPKIQEYHTFEVARNKGRGHIEHISILYENIGIVR